MKKIMMVMAIASIMLTGCSGYAYSGYNPMNDPLGMTTREEIREREATRRTELRVIGDVAIAEYNYKAESDKAYYDASARKTEARQKTYINAIWAGVSPLLLLMLVAGLVLIVAILKLFPSNFVPPMKDEYWNQ